MPVASSLPRVTPLLYCKDDPDAGRYWIRIQGDGPPQVLGEGSRVRAEGRGAKWCSPYGIKVDSEVRASACASRDKLQSCLFLKETHARYYDRDGKSHDLTVSSLSSRLDGNVIDGTATLKSADGRLKLAVIFHVGVRAWLELEDGGAR